jgi:phenylacetate-coenzyme A ligase PaaK-like adenylate-forming protein
MTNTDRLTEKIFQLSNLADFTSLALEVFRYQYEHNKVYQQFASALSVHPATVDRIEKIPFLPIEFFKNHEVVTGSFQEKVIFTSSGTTGMQTSKHYVKDLALYEESVLQGFRDFFGAPEEYVFLALLPSYLEREGSSLVHMAKKLMEWSGDPRGGFYLHDYEKLSRVLSELQNEKKKVVLLGVTYALLDLAEQFPVQFPDLILMETGGMKGNRKEMVREELHAQLKSAFGVDKIFSEYGMTELLSQAYSLGKGHFEMPPWMRVLIRDVNDPLTILQEGKTGGINVIDLANIHSCSFIATQDLGKKLPTDGFEVLGRFDNSDIRGCNLLVQ